MSPVLSVPPVMGLGVLWDKIFHFLLGFSDLRHKVNNSRRPAPAWQRSAADVPLTVPFRAQFEKCNSCLRFVLMLPLLLLPLLL